MQQTHTILRHDSELTLKNLAPDADGIICPVPYTAIPENQIATFIHPDGGQSIFYLDGRTLSVSTDHAEPITLGTLPADFRCCAIAGDALYVMTEGTMPTIARLVDQSWQLLPSIEALPPLSFAVSASSTFSTVTPTTLLNGSYSHWTGPVDSTDRDNITSQLIEGYRNLRDSATSAGYFSQPMMAWYTLVDRNGMSLFRSVPVIISPNGYNCLAPLSATAANGILNGVPMSLDAFTVAIHIPECNSQWASHIAGARVWMAPIPDPIDYDANAGITFGEAAVNGGTLNLQLPALASRNAVIPVMLDNLDTIGRCVARIALPFSRPGKVNLIEAFTADTTVARAKVTAAINANPSALSQLMLDTQQPHSFSAGSVAVAADMLVWGDITPVHAAPAAASLLLAATPGADIWSATTRITLSSGEVLSSTAPLTLASKPLELNPLIAWYGPDATLLEVELTSPTGSRLASSVTLQPTPGGRMSIACNTDLTPWLLSDAVGAPLTPVNVRVPVRHPGSVLSCPISAPLSPLSDLNVAQAPIHAILPAPGNGGTWNFARRHLYAIGAGGTYSLAVNSAGTVASAQLIDRRGIDSPHHAATLGDAVYLLSDTTLLKLSGSKLSTRLTDVVANRLVPLHRLMRLACVTSGGDALMVPPSARHFLSSPDGVVSLSRRIEVKGIRPRALRRVTWQLTSLSGALTLTILGDNGDPDNASVIASRTVDGAVTAPIIMAPITRPWRYLTVQLSAADSSRLRLDCITLLY